MALGLIPARGIWESRWFEVNSSTTFQQGDAVNFDPAYRVRTYVSTDSQILGISATSSTNSTKMRGLQMVQVYIPNAGATCYSDLSTGITQSTLSIGAAVGIVKVFNNTSYCSNVLANGGSLFSALAKIVGPIDATHSRVEIGLNIGDAVFYSTSTSTFAA